jgi:hypothetical protein
MLGGMAEVDPSEIARRHLSKLLGSEPFAKSETSRRLVTYLVERAIRNDAPKETEVAIDVFGKSSAFNGSDDSVVRVSVRTLRQKLAEYYAGGGRHDEIHFEIPKGGYRLIFAAQDPGVSTGPSAAPAEIPAAPSSSVDVADAPAAGASAPGVSAPVASATPETSRRWPRKAVWAIAAALALLGVSALFNTYQWHLSHEPVSPALSRVQKSATWSDMVESRRPLTIVLGDLFMFTQTDAATGRTVTVRDSGINSSEELRAYLASNPAFAAGRGQRYVTMIQKSAAIGMASILPIVNRPGRRVDVTVGDELPVETIRTNDIIYIGPMARLGPLAGHFLTRSRYRYTTEGSTITDSVAHKVFSPQGALGGERLDYALAARFTGPTGNHIMIFTSGARNAGLLQIVRSFTSPDELAAFEAKLASGLPAHSADFEALLTVRGFRATDLTAEVVEVHPFDNKP